MDNLEYSVEALSAKGLFYNKRFTVYVEGKDDKLFWKYLFELANKDAYIEDVGGKKELEKYIRKIVDEKAEFIVACDRDHNDFTDEALNNGVIRTYGYSIENSMYNIFELQSVIQKLSRSDVDVRQMLEEWLTEFSTNLEELIIYDVANYKYGRGKSILPDNCTRFLNSNQSCKISLDKVKKHIESVQDNFSEEEIIEVRQLIMRSPKKLWFHIRGHFLTNGVINIIKHFVKTHNGDCSPISLDTLYAFTIDCRENWEEKIDVKSVVEEIKKNCL